MKFTDKSGCISVELQPPSPGHSVLTTITDTGIGMSRSTIARIFEPFNQADSSLERSRGGLGLGLSVARKLVELHQGRIQAFSAGIGHGSQFTVVLPLHAEHSSMRNGRERDDQHNGNGHGRKILLVEDNADAAETMSMLLELMGHRVAIAASGSVAIEMSRTFLPSVVICDIGLPGMDGYEVARELRKSRLTCHLIALTGYGRDEDLRRARAAGFDLHLTKPIDPGVLESTLAGIGV